MRYTVHNLDLETYTGTTADFIDHAAKLGKLPKPNDLRYASSYDKSNTKWQGAPSYQAALEELQASAPGQNRGDPPPDNIVDLLRLHSPHRTMRKHYSGSVLNVRAFVAGRPECFYQIKPAKGVKRTLTLVADLAVSAFVEARTMAQRGRDLVSLIDTLEQFGIRTRVLLTIGLNKGAWRRAGTGTTFWVVRLKEAGCPLSPEQAFLLASPATFRLFVFRMLEHHDNRAWAKQYTGRAYGMPTLAPKYQTSLFPESLHEDYIFMGNDLSIWTGKNKLADQLINYIEKELK